MIWVRCRWFTKELHHTRPNRPSIFLSATSHGYWENCRCQNHFGMDDRDKGRLNLSCMNNLTHFVTYEDRSAHVQYHIRSHRKLSEDEQLRAITKKSLQTVIGQRRVYPNAPSFQLIQVDAADGWGNAD
jgi:hypothetical protein